MQCSHLLAPSNRRRLLRSVLALISVVALGLPTAPVASAGRASAAQATEMWAASWAASVHGPYPSGNAVAQPELKFAFPSPETGAEDQTFRLIVRPDLWSDQLRLRLANTFGTQSVAFDGVFVGLQASGGALAAGTNRPVTFAGGTRGVTIPAGQSVYSDPVTLDYVDDPANFLFLGRKLAVSFHVVGASGPMTWHAKAMQTSYVTAPGAGAHGQDESEAAFSSTTTSWYFLDALDALAPAGTAVVAALGDSITDGTGSTLNGDDRWPDVLARRLHAAYGTRVSVVNEGIGLLHRLSTTTTWLPNQESAGQRNRAQPIRLRSDRGDGGRCLGRGALGCLLALRRHPALLASRSAAVSHTDLTSMRRVARLMPTKVAR